MEYYNSSFTLLAKSESATTESLRGTESKFSNHTQTVSAGTYYVRVFNTSVSSQFFHIYFDDWGYPDITFASPDPFYTIGQPASADNGFAIGSYVSRTIWVASSGGSYWYGSSFVLGDIAPYSSRGPRVNGGVQKPNITAPGSAIISVRDTDVLTVSDPGWIDNDGTTGSGGANYYVMTGTSMACPIAAGAGALLLDKIPSATPLEVYDALQNSAGSSGSGPVPNNTWGYGMLDVFAASNQSPFPVELSSFTAKASMNGGIQLDWTTETEVDNYGFDILRQAQNDGWEKIGFLEGYGNSNSPKEYSFLDEGIYYGVYAYRLKQIDNDGTFEYSKVIEVDMNAPIGYELNQNYPNPFNPETTIKFNIAKPGFVKLSLYNILGELKGTLVNEFKEAGIHTVNINASELSSGIYIYKLEIEDFVQMRKMTLIK
jgi:hypothetical protein